MVFSLTKNISETPFSASQRASLMISVGLREIKEPRKYGIAQNEQRRSQPDAIFNGAHGATPRRLRENSSSSRASARSTGAIGRSARRSRGTCALCDSPATIDCNLAEISL